MTDVAFVALVTAVPTTLTAMAGIVVSLRNGRKTDAVKVEQAVAADKQQEIHLLVNSNLDTVKRELAAAKDETRELRDLIVRMMAADHPREAGK